MSVSKVIDEFKGMPTTTRMSGITYALRKNDKSNIYLVFITNMNGAYRKYKLIPLIHHWNISEKETINIDARAELLKEFNVYTITTKTEAKETLKSMLEYINV